VAGDGLFLGAPRYHVRRYLVARLKSWALYPLGRDGWLTPLIHAAKSRGIIEESRALRRAAVEPSTRSAVPQQQ